MKEKKIGLSDVTFRLASIGLGSITLLLSVFVTFLLSTDFSFQSIDWNQWAFNFAINGVLSILAILLSLNGISEILMTREDGSYMACFNALNGLTEELYEHNELVTFDGFVPWMEAHETRKTKINYLTRAGIDAGIARDIVDYASTSDIPTISGYDGKGKPSEAYGEEVIRKDKDGNDVYIPAIKGVWAKPVAKVLSNKVRVFFPNSAYFLTTWSGQGDDVSTGESAIRTERKRRRVIRSSVASRIISLGLMSAMFGLITVDVAMAENLTEKVWTFLSRLFIVVAGFVNGGVLACTSVGYLVKELKDKIKMIRDFHQYLASGDYKPIDYEEEKRRKIAKHLEYRAREERERAGRNQSKPAEIPDRQPAEQPESPVVSVDAQPALDQPSTDLKEGLANY